MTANLVVWKWADNYQKPHARRKEKLTNLSVVKEFMLSEDESKFGLIDLDGFAEAARKELVANGFSEDDVIIERYERCLVFNMGLRRSGELLPLIGSLAMKYGLNGTQA